MTNDDSLIQEIDDAMRQERMEKFWDENKAYIIAFVVLLILSTALTSGWRSWMERSNAHQTTLVMQAMSSETPAQALSQIQYDLSDNHLAIAKMNEAAVHLENGAYTEAIAAFDVVIGSRAPALWRDLAVILKVRTILDHDRTHAAPETLMAQLESAMRGDKGVWSAHARKYASLVAAELSADYQGAREWIAPLLNRSDLPASLSQDISALNAVYTRKAAEQKPQGAEPSAQTQG